VHRYASRPGFRLTVSRCDDDELTGLALSVRADRGDWWRDRCAEALGLDRAAEWLEPVIREVVHVAVAPDRQRQGAGRLLTEDAINEPEVASVVLSCHPGAEPAKGLYLSCGFQLLLEDFRTDPGKPGYWLMARRPRRIEL
jgi:ribosomal protein S18 acetylase RimI-like enzyme